MIGDDVDRGRGALLVTSQVSVEVLWYRTTVPQADIVPLWYDICHSTTGRYRTSGQISYLYHGHTARGRVRVAYDWTGL